MKNFIFPILVALAAAGFSVPSMAADGHDSRGAAPAQASAAAPLVDGLVKKVDKAAGKVTLSHGPLPNGMPAMTMPFQVKNAAWFDQMKAGDKIRFRLDTTNGALTISYFEPAK
ncbi:MAG: RND transporter [Rhodocyclaceae bacterium]|nr:MAG: RND transporter [Rhodocyclaceae bacterium]